MTHSASAITSVGSTVFAYGCTISGNDTGINLGANGDVRSFGLNAFSNNGDNGTFSSTPGTL